MLNLTLGGETMVIDFNCENCGDRGRVWLPRESDNLVLSCPVCNVEKDFTKIHLEIWGVTSEEKEYLLYLQLKQKYEK